ncbi:hypothetical protein H4Q26_014842 [Puccinia striiformis f. sp. tritici PST-130]|nr:hypothetical protein Pst134EB_010477 [Puccinia striiformis f. sp. tritici]KAI9622903.1 hypothetical protein H4Q26_014842 [Puccinia striiformis f. sp. tritici PST-130]
MAKITDLPLEVLQVIFHHFSLSLYKAEKAEKEEAEFLDSDRTSEDEISFRASGIDEQAYLPTYHHLAAHRVGCLRLVCRRWAKFLYDTMYFGLTFYSTSQAVAFAKYARKNPQCLRRIKCRYLMFHNVPEAITYKAMRMVIRLLSQTIDTLHIVFSELAAALSDQTVEAIGGMPRLRILKLSNDRYQENEAPVCANALVKAAQGITTLYRFSGHPAIRAWSASNHASHRDRVVL